VNLLSIEGQGNFELSIHGTRINTLNQGSLIEVTPPNWSFPYRVVKEESVPSQFFDVRVSRLFKKDYGIFLGAGTFAHARKHLLYRYTDIGGFMWYESKQDTVQFFRSYLGVSKETEVFNNINIGLAVGIDLVKYVETDPFYVSIKPSNWNSHVFAQAFLKVHLFDAIKVGLHYNYLHAVGDFLIDRIGSEYLSFKPLSYGLGLSLHYAFSSQ